MNKTNCELIQDLLPLYMDDACSSTSKTLVVNHLKECPDCQKIHDNMAHSIKSNNKDTELNAKYAFQHLRKKVLWIIAFITILVLCYVTNLLVSWNGFHANVLSFLVTIAYIAMVSTMIVFTKDIKSFVTFTSILSMVTFFSAIYAVLIIMLDIGGFLSAIIVGPFTSIPFWGLTMLMDSQYMYMVVAILSFIWLIITRKNKHRIKTQLTL